MRERLGIQGYERKVGYPGLGEEGCFIQGYERRIGYPGLRKEGWVSRVRRGGLDIQG